MLNQKRYRILLVDDNPSIHDDFRKFLIKEKVNADLQSLEEGLFGDAPEKNDAPEYQIDSAFQGQEAIDKVVVALQQDDPYAMAFVDMRMPPGIDGVQTVEAIWNEAPDLQIVICTAYSDYSWSEMISRLGRTDRLLILKKPFERIEVCQLALSLSVKSELAEIAKMKSAELSKMVAERTCELEAEIERRQRIEVMLMEEHSELELKASIDPTTGLQNRSAISERILRLANQAMQLQASFSILFIDVDHFKLVNDTHGHRAGDEVLKQVATRLKETLRNTDSIGRYGGEEFAVGLINCNHDEAAIVGERLIKAVAKSPIVFEGQTIPITVSIGTASENVLRDSCTDELFERADKALYVAKNNGRNRVEQFAV